MSPLRTPAINNISEQPVAQRKNPAPTRKPPSALTAQNLPDHPLQKRGPALLTDTQESVKLLGRCFEPFLKFQQQ